MANQYLPTDFVSKQVPFGMLNFSLDGKLMYFDKVNFVQRAFISRQEILLWFPLGSLARKGRFEICMNTGGTLGSNGIITGGVDSIWWFSAGEADVNLIQKYYTTLEVDSLISGSNLTFNNGLRKKNGVVKMGADLTTSGTTNVGFLTETTVLALGDFVTQNGAFFKIEPGQISMTALQHENFGASVTVNDASEIYLKTIDTGSVGYNKEIAFKILPDGEGTGQVILVTDDRGRGITLADDYYETQLDRDLIDKGNVLRLINENTTPNATTTLKGKLRLAGDLSGTSDLPTVPGLLSKANISGQIFTGNISAQNLSGTNTGDQDLSIYELLSNKVSNLSSPNSNTYLNTLGLSTALAGKVNTSVPITNGYGVTVGGDLTSAVSISLNTSVIDNRYIRKDIDDNNGVHKLLLGSLESGDTLLTGDLTIQSLEVGTSDDILVVGTGGIIQKKTLVIAGNFGIANSAGTNVFDVDLGTDLIFEGLNDTTVTFDPITKKISISSIPGSGSGVAVVSFNSRTGAIVPVSGDYTTNLVPESGGVQYFTNTRAIASTLTGFSASTTTAIVAADSIIQAFGKAQGQINNRVPISREITIAGTAGRLIIGGGETQNLSANPNWTIDLSTIGTGGSYMKVTTDAYGRVISGSNPTTLGSFGITDAYTKAEADGKYYLQTNPSGFITAASLPDLSPYALKTGVGSTGIWPIGITGNSGSATFWGSGNEIVNEYIPSINNAMIGFGYNGKWGYASKTVTQNHLDINNGSTLTNNISGNAATVTDGEIIHNKQNSLSIDGTGIKYPTVDAVNNSLVNKVNNSNFLNYKSLSNLGLKSSNCAIVAIGDSNLEGYYTALTGEDNWFTKFKSDIQKTIGGKSYQGFTNFSNPGIYGLTLSGTTNIVEYGPTNTAIQMNPGSEISFSSSAKYVELWFNRISGGGTLEFYYNDVLYRTISTSGTTHNDYPSYYSPLSDTGISPVTPTPSNEIGSYRIRAVGSNVIITSLFKSILEIKEIDDFSFLMNAVAGTTFTNFNINSIKNTTGLSTDRDVFYILALGINSIYSSSSATTSNQYVLDLKSYITGLISNKSDLVYVMPPKPTGSIFSPILEPYENYYDKAKMLCDENNVFFIDLNIPKNSGLGDIYGSDGLHYSILGHTIIYNYITNQIAKYRSKINDLESVTKSGNYTKDGIQLIGDLYKYDINKDGLILSGGGIAGIRSGNIVNSIDLSENSISFFVPGIVANSNLIIRNKDDENMPSVSLEGNMKIHSLSGTGLEIIGEGGANPVMKVKSSGNSFGSISLYGAESITNANSLQIGQYANGNTFFLNGGNSKMSFYTNSDERMSILGDGNVIVYGNITASNLIGNASSASVVPWSGVTGKPSFFSGDYNDLSNKPTIPTNTNQLTNGAGFITSAALSAYLPLTGGALTGAVTSSASISANGFFDTSDIRLKEVIDQSFDTSSIKAISYKRRDMSDNKTWVGYSAQDVREVMPDAVFEDDNGMLSLNYTQVLVNKVKFLEERLAKLEGGLHGMG